MTRFEQRIYQRERKVRLKAKGLCQDCGQFQPEPERTMCWRCLENRKRREKGQPRLKGTVRPHGAKPQKEPVRESAVYLDRMMQLLERLSA